MAQFGRPSSDVATGNWTTTPLYSKLNETSPDDGTFAQLNYSASSTFECALSSITDPGTDVGLVVRIRVKRTGTGSITETGYLVQGTTVISTITLTLTTLYNTIEYSVPDTETVNITNFGDLRVRVTGVANASGRYAYVSWIELQAPNAPTLVRGSKGSYTKGRIEDFRGTPTPLPSYTHGQIEDFRGIPTPLPAYTEGAVAGTPIIDSKDAYSKGRVEDFRGTPTPLPAYLSGSTDVRSEAVHVYLSGNVVDFRGDPKFAYTKGIVYDFRGSPTPLPAYTKGNIVNLRGSVHAFLDFAYLRNSKSAYVEGYTEALTASGSVHAYIKAPEPTTSTAAFVLGIENIIVPNGYIESVGTWTNELGGINDIYQSIDETVANDSDFITNIDLVTSDYYECALTDVSGQPGDGDVVVFWRGVDNTGAGLTATVQLRQGNTVIASSQQVLTTARATYYFTLTAGERANITDWDDLRLRFILSTP